MTESFIQKEIRRKVSELCGEIQLLELAVKSLAAEHKNELMGWDDLTFLAEKLGDSAISMGEVAYCLTSWNQTK